MRHGAKSEYRRHQNLAVIADLRERERELLVLKHDVPEPPPGTFGLPVDDSNSTSLVFVLSKLELKLKIARN